MATGETTKNTDKEFSHNLMDASTLADSSTIRSMALENTHTRTAESIMVNSKMVSNTAKAKSLVKMVNPK